MTQPVRDMLIGSVSAIALLGLSTLLFLFGELDPIFNPRYPVTVLINDAGGLRPGSVIELNGVQVGIVDEVTNRLGDDPAHFVHIIALIQDQVRIPADAAVRIDQSLIGSAAKLQFVTSGTGDATAVASLPTDGSAVITGRQKDLLEQVGDVLDQRLQPLTASLEHFEELTGTYNTLGRNLNDLVRPQNDDEIAAEPNARVAVARLNAAISDVRGILNDDFRRTLRLAEDWLGDEQIRNDVRTTLEQGRLAAENLNRTLDRYRELADELAASGDDAVQHLARASDELSATVEEVRRVAKLAADGQGTAAQMLKNPDLYNSLHDAAARLDQVLVQLQLLIEKIRSEGLRVGG